MINCIVQTIGVEFWFCLGGSYLVTLRGVCLKLWALKLQHCATVLGLPLFAPHVKANI